jgi:hypothetical protein
MRLPYALNNLNVLTEYIDPQAGFQIVGNELSWHFEDFEPTDNIYDTLANPGDWQALLQDEQTVKAHPKDGEAWGRIGKEYKRFFLPERGFRAGDAGTALFNLGREAYQNCVDLLPNDADWHFGYGELLWQTAYYPGCSGSNGDSHSHQPAVCNSAAGSRQCHPARSNSCTHH